MFVLQILVMIFGAGVVYTWLIYFLHEERRSSETHRYTIDINRERELRKL